MSFKWLKQYMPRSLYGRAALILVLPVVTLQLVVSVIFIQRHFDDVTQQMSRELARATNLALSLSNSQVDALKQLDLEITVVDESVVPAEDIRRWYDFTGVVVIRELNRKIPGLQRVALPDDGVVELYIRRDDTLFLVETSRGRVSATNPHQLLVNMVFFGVLMTLIAFLYLRNQLRPITRLATAAEAFGRGRHEVYSPSGAVEVRAAGSAFVDMRARIERHIEQRTMMLSGVSHDLRTPITRLRLGLSLLEEEDRAPLEQDVEEMQLLIDSFLDFARGDAQDAETELVDPFMLVTDIVQDAQRTGQDVEIAELEGDGEVRLRPRPMRRAVENLVGNARRYGSICRVSVFLSAKALRIRVEDDGPGIPAEERERAMRPFVRLDPARNQDRGSGVGLGLAIAADIARAHGGVLRLGESAELGGLRADIVIGL
ncbi:ATP-binding protein [uncultured Pelagimonas sp.]|uniref:ATP-binding protein n=1 Tax=uncultured Pelagimonas sp. TaxID=1618102 RepID=UPI002623FFEC|nr:ATP-binding protein [uncultured Pelagimonas sp.]